MAFVTFDLPGVDGMLEAIVLLSCVVVSLYCSWLLIKNEIKTDDSCLQIIQNFNRLGDGLDDPKQRAARVLDLSAGRVEGQASLGDVGTDFDGWGNELSDGSSDTV